MKSLGRKIQRCGFLIFLAWLSLRYFKELSLVDLNIFIKYELAVLPLQLLALTYVFFWLRASKRNQLT